MAIYAIDSIYKILEEQEVKIEEHDRAQVKRWSSILALGVYHLSHGMGKEELKKLLAKEYDIRITSVETYLKEDGGAVLKDADMVGNQALAAFMEARTYEDAVRLAIYMNRYSAAAGAIAGSWAEAYYGTVAALTVELKEYISSMELGVLDKFQSRFPVKIIPKEKQIKRNLLPRFERLAIEDLQVMPPVIDRFRGPFGFLSNFAAVPIEYEGMVFPNVEAAYQAAKLLHKEERVRFTRPMSPGLARRYGRSLKNFRKDWCEVRRGIMKSLLEKKFINHKTFRQKLLATGTSVLREGNTWNDVYWGVCEGKGENQLGQLLMEIRERLRNT